MSDTLENHYKNLLFGAEDWAIEQVETEIEELERENVALKTSITQSLVYLSMKERLENENAALREQLQRAKVENNHNWQFQSIHEETLKENAALRELLHRSLHWLDDYDSRLSGSAKIADDIKEVLRKEAQP